MYDSLYICKKQFLSFSYCIFYGLFDGSHSDGDSSHHFLEEGPRRWCRSNMCLNFHCFISLEHLYPRRRTFIATNSKSRHIWNRRPLHTPDIFLSDSHTRLVHKESSVRPAVVAAWSDKRHTPRLPFFSMRSVANL